MVPVNAGAWPGGVRHTREDVTAFHLFPHFLTIPQHRPHLLYVFDERERGFNGPSLHPQSPVAAVTLQLQA